MREYPLNTEIIQQLQDIIEKSEQSKPSEQRLNPKSLYLNIYNSIAPVDELVKIFEVPKNLITKIKDTKALREDKSAASMIRQQLIAMDTNALMCWGSSNWKFCGPQDPHHNGYLSFNIQNVKNISKGMIQITLNYRDLYNIEIFNENNPEPMFEYKDIFADQLIDIIGDCIGF